MAGAAHLDEVETGALRRAAHGRIELFIGDAARTRRLHQEPVGSGQLNRTLGQLAVGVECPIDVRLALGERRRIDDDDVVVLAALDQAIHHLVRVADHRVVLAVAHVGERGVVREVALGDGQSRRALVDAGHSCRATGRRVDAEPAGRRRTRRAPACRPTSSRPSARFSRWSRKWPVFWPWTTSASNTKPFSWNSTGSVGVSPISAMPSLKPYSLCSAMRPRQAQHQRRSERTARRSLRPTIEDEGSMSASTASRRRCRRSDRGPGQGTRRSRR